MSSIADIRLSMRCARRNLNPSQQQQAASQLIRRLLSQPIFLRSKHIAVYWPNDGEIDLRPLVTKIHRANKFCYLPVLKPFSQKLAFCRYQPGQSLKNNKYGIPEPQFKHACVLPPKALDLVLAPLVAFDKSGNRIGMGGGYYDQTFAFKGNSTSRKPYLVGVAHHFQQIPKIAARPWDVKLDMIITNNEVIQRNP